VKFRSNVIFCPCQTPRDSALSAFLNNIRRRQSQPDELTFINEPETRVALNIIHHYRSKTFQV